MIDRTRSELFSPSKISLRWEKEKAKIAILLRENCNWKPQKRHQHIFGCFLLLTRLWKQLIVLEDVQCFCDGIELLVKVELLEPSVSGFIRLFLLPAGFPLLFRLQLCLRPVMPDTSRVADNLSGEGKKREKSWKFSLNQLAILLQRELFNLI